MLATLTAEPFDKAGWVYEEKYDGDRILAYKEDDRVRLLSRSAEDRTARFPGIADAIRNLAPSTLLLDGEIVVFDKRGVSRFQLLQQAAGQPSYVIFDCLFCDGKDLRGKPLATRRVAMLDAIGSNRVLRASRRLASNGLVAFRLAKRRGYEGLVAKDLSSHYGEGRSSKWLKVKVHQEDEFVIAGFTAPSGSRKYFGALLLGAYEEGRLRYVGKVGTGFTEKRLAELSKLFRPLVRKRTTLVEPPLERGITYLAARLIAQVSFQEWTADRKLRQPVFLGLRDDKRPQEVVMPAIPT